MNILTKRAIFEAKKMMDEACAKRTKYIMDGDVVMERLMDGTIEEIRNSIDEMINEL